MHVDLDYSKAILKCLVEKQQFVAPDLTISYINMSNNTDSTHFCS